jgi:hypothetical protein
MEDLLEVLDRVSLLDGWRRHLCGYRAEIVVEMKDLR